MELVEKQQAAKECLAQDDFPSAVSLYEQCIESYPKEMSNYWLLGLALLLAGKEGEAISLWLSLMVEGTSEEVETWTAELTKVLEAEAVQRLQSLNFGEAAKIYWQILELKPNHIEAYKNLSYALFNQNQLEEACATYQQVLTLDPNYHLAYSYLGYAFQQQGFLEKAISYYQQYLKHEPEDVGVYYNLGCALQQQGKLSEAQACYDIALKLDANCGKAYNNKGAALEMQGLLSEAQACYEEFLRLNPQDARAYYNLGNIFQQQGLLAEARNYYEQSLLLNPHQSIAHNNLGTILHGQGFHAEALFHYQQAFTLDESYTLAHYNLGVMLLDNCQFEEALACFNRVLEIDLDYVEAHWARALILLRWGDYPGGFAELEWRWRRQGIIPHFFSQPLWTGEELEGKTILLYCEPGFGDTIQFMRYVPLVQQRGGKIVIECYQPLVRLLSAVSGVERVIATGTTLPEFDVQAPLFSLPRIFGTTLATIPVQIPYLVPPGSEISLYTPPGTQIKIGIVWASGYREEPEMQKMYKQKSCPLSMFVELLAIPGITLYSLQVGRDASDITPYCHETRLQDLSNLLHDFGDTAAAIPRLDLVISVDTAVVHLAGALGGPVWVLLPFNPDWRWMSGHSHSDWYPNIRLFCQKQPGDWAEVFGRVRCHLQDFVDKRN